MTTPVFLFNTGQNSIVVEVTADQSYIVQVGCSLVDSIVTEVLTEINRRPKASSTDVVYQFRTSTLQSGALYRFRTKLIQGPSVTLSAPINIRAPTLPSVNNPGGLFLINKDDTTIELGGSCPVGPAVFCMWKEVGADSYTQSAMERDNGMDLSILLMALQPLTTYRYFMKFVSPDHGTRIGEVREESTFAVGCPRGFPIITDPYAFYDVNNRLCFTALVDTGNIVVAPPGAPIGAVQLNLDEAGGQRLVTNGVRVPYNPNIWSLNTNNALQPGFVYNYEALVANNLGIRASDVLSIRMPDLDFNMRNVLQSVAPGSTPLQFPPDYLPFDDLVFWTISPVSNAQYPLPTATWDWEFEVCLENTFSANVFRADGIITATNLLVAGTKRTLSIPNASEVLPNTALFIRGIAIDGNNVIYSTPSQQITPQPALSKRK